MNGILSPVALIVLATAMLLGGFVAPLFAFLFAAFVVGAVHAFIEDRRRPFLSS
jgi:uncharacterized membrane protein YphA (DoxX/SURF4 family)